MNRRTSSKTRDRVKQILAGRSLIMIGLMFQAGFSLVSVKLILILLFVFYTGPTTTHALARACLYGGVEPEAARRDRAGQVGEGEPPSNP